MSRLSFVVGRSAWNGEAAPFLLTLRTVEYSDTLLRVTTLCSPVVLLLFILSFHQRPKMELFLCAYLNPMRGSLFSQCF
jgi:hypothetical protein